MSVHSTATGSPLAQPARGGELEETLGIRRRAARVLECLMAERARLEARLAAHGRRDPIKSVTGRSAMENAIATTQQIIGAMDRLLSQARGGAPANGAAAAAVNAQRAASAIVPVAATASHALRNGSHPVGRQASGTGDRSVAGGMVSGAAMGGSGSGASTASGGRELLTVAGSAGLTRSTP